MTTDQKIIKNKLGMLKLAEKLGSVSLELLFRSLLLFRSELNWVDDRSKRIPVLFRCERHFIILPFATAPPPSSNSSAK